MVPHVQGESTVTTYSSLSLGNVSIPDFSFLARGFGKGAIAPLAAGGHSGQLVPAGHQFEGESRKEISRSRLLSERGTPPSDSSETPLRKTLALTLDPDPGRAADNNGGPYMDVDGDSECEGEGNQGYQQEVPPIPPPAYTSVTSSQVDPQEYQAGISHGGIFSAGDLETRLRTLENGLAACEAATQNDVLQHHVLQSVQGMIHQFEQHIKTLTDEAVEHAERVVVQSAEVYAQKYNNSCIKTFPKSKNAWRPWRVGPRSLRICK